LGFPVSSLALSTVVQFVIWNEFISKDMMCFIVSALEGRRENYELNFPESNVKNRFFYLTSLYIVCFFILLP